jgi:hypothetical protein
LFDKIILSSLLHVLQLLKDHRLLCIVQTTGILAQFVDMGYVIISSSACGILQKQVLEGVELAKPRFRALRPIGKYGVIVKNRAVVKRKTAS